MIEITNKEDCCGCSACEQVCPVKCIEMRPDSEGFIYPFVEISRCIDCHRCERICPTLNAFSPRNPKSAYAAINLDEEVRQQSSSGGIFSLLANEVLKEGGVIFGARFDDEWQIELGYAESKDGISTFRGSKYVQANPRKVFIEARNFLKQGRKVLFSGTPCQIAGLKHFLNKDYENLTTVDFICHGVPSPGVWKKYLLEARATSKRKSAFRRFLEKVPFCYSLKNMPTIKGISFREKSAGWKKFRFVLSLAESLDDGKKSSVSSSCILKEFHYDNPFMRAFLSNLILRPSCYECHTKCGKSHSDATIADFWGVEAMHLDMDDDKGTSLVMVNTDKGRDVLNDIKYMLRTVVTDFQEAVSKNPSWYESPICHPRRSVFFRRLNKSYDIIELIKSELTRNQKISLRQKIKHILKTFLVRVKNMIGNG